MPEYMGKKITRAEESARHAYRRALEKSLRARVKGTGWKSAYGTIFREQAGWFIKASPSVHIYEHVTEAIIGAKPMAIDPIFWDLVGLPENREQPLSFRANGAWACRPPYFAEVRLEEDDDPAVVGERLFAVATEQLENVTRSYSLERFLSACREANSDYEAYLSSIIPTLIAMHRQDEALAICEEACLQGLSGGFHAPEGSFVKMAAAYLRRSAMEATRH
jgi:hypothetical protein